MEQNTTSRSTGTGEDADRIRQAVREGYARVAGNVPGGGCCGSASGAAPGAAASTAGCCGAKDVRQFAREIGYGEADLAATPEGANLGLSCGNPTALASLQPGEVVVDLGCGAGFDVFIAAPKVAPGGTVIGVDMTPEMLQRARENAAKIGVANVEFRLGEIENLPVADASAAVVISNCVINLSPDKPRVFREIARVLRPGGRLAVSDMALLRPLPAGVREDLAAYVGCVSGAVLLEEYERHIRDAGFVEVVIEPQTGIDALEDVQDPLYRRVKEQLPAGTRPTDYLVSVRVSARKPRE